jgi:hypothetical protein
MLLQLQIAVNFRIPYNVYGKTDQNGRLNRLIGVVLEMKHIWLVCYGHMGASSMITMTHLNHDNKPKQKWGAMRNQIYGWEVP